MTAAADRLLVVEDSEPLGRQMVAALSAVGYEIDWIRRGDAALAVAFDRYRLVILDLMLPGASGFEILERLRGQGVRVPVVVVSGRTDSRDKQRALDLGVSAYLTKPFWPQELLDCVAAHLRRPDPPRGDVIEIGELSIDVGARDVRVDGQLVFLTPVEFDLLATLARRCGAAVFRAELLDQIAGEGRDTSPQALEEYVSDVKEKLGRSGARIKTAWGVGYRLDE